jgi:hypothetical protein
MHPLSKKGGNMFKKIMLIAVATVISSCDPLEGVISVKEKITYKNTANSFDCFKDDGNNNPNCYGPDVKTIEPGEYKISIDQTSKRALTVEIKNKSVSHKLELKTQKKAVPSQGEFNLTSAESEQPFDLKSALRTEISRTESRNETLYCTETRYAGRDCYLIPGKPNEGSKEVCDIREDIFAGEEYQEYYYSTETKYITGTLLVQNKTVADLNGSRTDTDKIVTYNSGCRNLRYIDTRIRRN